MWRKSTRGSEKSVSVDPRSRPPFAQVFSRKNTRKETTTKKKSDGIGPPAKARMPGNNVRGRDRHSLTL
ncbi:hypothetical protein CVT25_013793 [Psilocybe cyanescens]|uniref:Uncharacterized protein n=1 Tax=Psilocybe cyanescens TaxID=93625 RepID=A0A409WTT5_PSICY|nr:hypothetical protein CVT25_013793 [Psilocybe cyanescens]